MMREKVIGSGESGVGSWVLNHNIIVILTRFILFTEISDTVEYGSNINKKSPALRRAFC